MKEGVNFELQLKLETRIWDKEKGPETEKTFNLWVKHSNLSLVTGWGHTNLMLMWVFRTVFRFYHNHKDYKLVRLDGREWVWKRDYMYRKDILLPWALELPENRQEWPNVRGTAETVFDKILLKLLGPWRDLYAEVDNEEEEQNG